MLIPDRDRPAARIEAEALRHLARLDPAVAARLDRPAVPLAPTPAGRAFEAADEEHLLLADARPLADGLGLPAVLHRAGAEARLLLTVAAVVAALTGAGLVAAAGLVTGSGLLNVYAVLVVLVGLNGLGLLVWLLGLALGGHLGRGAAALAGRGAGFAGEGWLRRLGVGGAGLAARLAFLEATLGRAVQPWASGALIHAFWAIALLAASAVLALRLAVEQVDFIWETTLLSAAHFEWLTMSLGRWPSVLGFPVPDAAQIALTAGGVPGPGDAPAVVAARRAWAGWLIGCTLFWGLLPRCLALGACLVLWRRRDRRQRLPLSHPFWLHRLQRLAPGAHRLGSSAAPATPVGHEPSLPGQGSGSPVAAPPERGLGPSPGRVMGLELDDAFPWPPALPPGWEVIAGDVPVSLAGAAGAEAGTRLVVLVSLLRAPDRGLARRLAEAATTWGGRVELALVDEARALKRLGSAEAVRTRAVDWAATAQAAGLVDCFRLPADERLARGGTA